MTSTLTRRYYERVNAYHQVGQEGHGQDVVMTNSGGATRKKKPYRCQYMGCYQRFSYKWNPDRQICMKHIH